jgi:hypothetical protein
MFKDQNKIIFNKLENMMLDKGVAKSVLQFLSWAALGCNFSGLIIGCKASCFHKEQGRLRCSLAQDKMNVRQSGPKKCFEADTIQSTCQSFLPSCPPGALDISIAESAAAWAYSNVCIPCDYLPGRPSSSRYLNSTMPTES